MASSVLCISFCNDSGSNKQKILSSGEVNRKSPGSDSMMPHKPETAFVRLFLSTGTQLISISRSCAAATRFKMRPCSLISLLPPARITLFGRIDRQLIIFSTGVLSKNSITVIPNTLSSVNCLYGCKHLYISSRNYAAQPFRTETFLQILQIMPTVFCEKVQFRIPFSQN